MCHRDAPLGHHLDKIPVAQLGAHVPAHVQDGDLAVKVPVLEKRVEAGLPDVGTMTMTECITVGAV